MNKIYWLAVLCLSIMLSMCTSTKNVQKGSLEVSTEKDDSIRTLIAERDRFIELYNELMYAGVTFNEDPIDTVMGDEVDTSRIFIGRTPGWRTKSNGNSIEIGPHGEIKASGNIKSAYVAKSVFQSLLVAKDKTIDSLARIKQKVTVKTEYKDKIVKRTVFPWWFLLIGGGIFIVIKKMKII